MILHNGTSILITIRFQKFGSSYIEYIPNDEQKAISLLILARENYTQENYTAGDKYLKKVEKMKDKTKFVISLFEEIRKNKIFYKNRVDENHKPLFLTLKYKNN